MLRGLLDRAIGLVLLVLCSPLLMLSAVAIKLTSPGPVLYRATRAGKGGKPFIMYKLRTMHVGAEAGGRITASADPRTFTVGVALRRVKIDEIPQFLNVVRGEMRLVGPRPEDPDIVREHYSTMMWESLAVPPGMTSAGSLHYSADETQLPGDPRQAETVYLERLLPRKIAVDLQYVRSPRFSSELEILARTVLSLVGLDRLFPAARQREQREAAEILREYGAAP